MKSALITGNTGQDGSYLAELLLHKGYAVHGIIRRASNFNTDRIDHIYQDPHLKGSNLKLHYGDLSDASSLRRLIETTKPDEIYNLGAQSHVKVSFELPEFTGDVDALGPLRLFEAARDVEQHTGRKIKIYQAGTSEMYGATPPPQNEQTPFYPRSPYGASKVAAHWYGINYREAYNMFICNGILFNHESPRRGETFVTRKITRALGRIKVGLQSKLYLGNLDSKRDWGFAGDYVEGMWRMLQHESPGDYVLATGEAYSVREFLDESFGLLGLDWKQYVEIDPRYYRPTEVDNLQGDSTKARTVLGWKPQVGFKQLVKMMVEHDLALAEQEKTLADAGHSLALRGTADGIDARGIKTKANAA
ncbi:MAG: GDP-mannose 4,6-dehydratase [Alphaproteobacteria bacterium]